MVRNTASKLRNSTITPVVSASRAVVFGSLLLLPVLWASEFARGYSADNQQDKVGDMATFIEGSLQDELSLPMSRALLKFVDDELQRNLGNPRLLWCKGILLEQRGRKEEGRLSRLRAIRAAESDRSFDPKKLLQYYKNLADLQRDHGDINLAAELFIKIIQRDRSFVGEYKSFHPDFRLPTTEGGTGGLAGTGQHRNHYGSSPLPSPTPDGVDLEQIKRQWGPLPGFFDRYIKRKQDLMNLLGPLQPQHLDGLTSLELARRVGFPDRYCYRHEDKDTFCWIYTDERSACEIVAGTNFIRHYAIKGTYEIHLKFEKDLLRSIESDRSTQGGQEKDGNKGTGTR